MYDTARRVALVKQRVRENTRRRQRREAISLSAVCMLLCAVRAETEKTGQFSEEPPCRNQTHKKQESCVNHDL